MSPVWVIYALWGYGFYKIMKWMMPKVDAYFADEDWLNGILMGCLAACMVIAMIYGTLCALLLLIWILK